MKIPSCRAKSSQAVAFANNRLAAALGLCGLLGAGPALAADRTWTGGGTSDNTNVAANWGGTVPIATDRLIYAGNNRRAPFNDLSGSTIFSGVRFSATAGAFTVSGGSLRIGGAIDFSGNPSAPISQTISHSLFLTNTLTVMTQVNGAITLGGVISDGGSLRALAKTGDGTLTLSGLSLFGGQAQLGSGTVNINSLANAGTASSLGLGSGVPIILIGSGVSNATLVYTGTAAASTNRQVQVGFGSANSEAGGASIVNNLADPAHVLTFSNSIFNAANTSATVGRTLTLEGSNTGLNTISGAIVNNAASAPISLTKAGSGTWLLSGASSYSGPTTVSGGTLRVSGSLGNTAMTVASGATLTGTGVIGTTGVLNTLTVNGTMAPGPSTGLLTVHDNLSLPGTLVSELNGTGAGTGYDQVVVNGAVDVTGGTLNPAFGFTPVNGNILFLVVNDGADAVTGTFAGLPQNEILVSVNGLDVRISYTADAAGGTFTGGNDIALMAVAPPTSTIGLVTGTLTVGPPHGTENQLSVTVTPDGLAGATDTSDLTGTIDLTVNIDPATGKTALLTLADGEVNGTDMNFSGVGYGIDATGLTATVDTVTPPGSVDPDTGVFAASQHGFEINQGAFAGTVGGQPLSVSLAANPISGLGVGSGSLTLTPAGSSGPYNLFNAVVILPIALADSITSSGVTMAVAGTGTIRATGQLQIPSSEFNAWMIGQGATSFDPTADTAGNGAPDAIKWALGLATLNDNPLPFLLKPVPSAPGTFTISLPPGGTVAPLTVESSGNLQSPWTPVPAGEISSGVNPIPAGSTGQIGVTPTATDRIFLRLRSDP